MKYPSMDFKRWWHIVVAQGRRYLARRRERQYAHIINMLWVSQGNNDYARRLLVEHALGRRLERKWWKDWAERAIYGDYKP